MVSTYKIEHIYNKARRAP